MSGADKEFTLDVAEDAIELFVPFGGNLARRMFGSVLAEWKRNRSVALAAAEEASGLTREQFAEWATEEPRAVPLYLKVLWASGMNGHDQVLRAMGAVLGSAAHATAAGDEHGFDMAELALRAMGDMTPRHFAVLGELSRADVIRGEDGTPNYANFMPASVAKNAGLPHDVAHQCLINLLGAGLVGSIPVFEGSAYPITELGRAVVLAAIEATEMD